MRHEVAPGLSIDEAEISEQFVRATGPGGQHVNKVSTAVALRFDIAGSPSLPEPVKRRLIAAMGRAVTGDGVLVLRARAHRSQERNREEARLRLFEAIRAACERPKRRIATRPTAGGRARRLEGKAHRASRKRDRAASCDPG